jgi:DNA-directed RNA polymerase subunit F
MNPEMLKETPMTMAEVKSELARIKKKEEELSFRSNKTDEYLQNVDILSLQKAEELRKKLEGLKLPRLKPEHIVKIIDVLPTSVNDLKVLLQGYTVTVNQDNMKKIVDVVQGYAKKK